MARSCLIILLQRQQNLAAEHCALKGTLISIKYLYKDVKIYDILGMTLAEEAEEAEEEITR